MCSFKHQHIHERKIDDTPSILVPALFWSAVRIVMVPFLTGLLEMVMVAPLDAAAVCGLSPVDEVEPTDSSVNTGSGISQQSN